MPAETCEICGAPTSTRLSHAETITIDAPPEAVYDLVSDVTRTGEWSPICRAAWWDDGDGPREDAWFTGRNQTGDTVWETRSRVEIADRPREFAWLVSDGYVRWGYRLAPVDGGTELTESWHLRGAGLAMFHEKYGDGAHDRIALRSIQALEGIPITLAAIKKLAET
jgi:hypothetical protein